MHSIIIFLIFDLQTMLIQETQIRRSPRKLAFLKATHKLAILKNISLRCKKIEVLNLE